MKKNFVVGFVLLLLIAGMGVGVAATATTTGAAETGEENSLNIEEKVAEKLEESRERLGEIKPRIDEKLEQMRRRLGLMASGQSYLLDGDLGEIRKLPEGVVNITPIKEVTSALKIVSVRQWYDLGNDEEERGFRDFKVYEVTLRNSGKDKIYFYSIVYTDTISSTNLKLRTMDPGEVGTISTSVQLEDRVTKIIVALEEIEHYTGYDGKGYNNPNETQIFSLDAEKLQPPKWLWVA